MHRIEMSLNCNPCNVPYVAVCAHPERSILECAPSCDAATRMGTSVGLNEDSASHLAYWRQVGAVVRCCLCTLANFAREYFCNFLVRWARYPAALRIIQVNPTPPSGDFAVNQCGVTVRDRTALLQYGVIRKPPYMAVNTLKMHQRVHMLVQSSNPMELHQYMKMNMMNISWSSPTIQ
jgi:hypothetical protein